MTNSAAAATQGSGLSSGNATFFILLIACIYFFPTIVAILRRVNVFRVILINLLFGWTLIGWISAMVLASARKLYLVQPEVTIIQQAAPAPAVAPPGWYADPTGPGQRYWDGTRWLGYE